MQFGVRRFGFALRPNKSFGKKFAFQSRAIMPG
jgi:hypothetical protein